MPDRRALERLAKELALLVGIIVAFQFFPDWVWHAAAVAALIWCYRLGKFADNYVSAAASSPASIPGRRLIPVPGPPLAAKYVFRVTWFPDALSKRLELTPTVLIEHVDWPELTEVEQWGDRFRWRTTSARGKTATWDTVDPSSFDSVRIWSWSLDPSRPDPAGLPLRHLTLDWCKSQLRLYAEGGDRFGSTYVPDRGSIEHSKAVLLVVGFPMLQQEEQIRYRDTEHYDFQEKYGWEVSSAVDEPDEHFTSKEVGFTWWITRRDYRPSHVGYVIKNKTTKSRDGAESTWILVEEWMTGAAGHRFWVPSETIEPDKRGNIHPPKGAPVVLVLGFDNGSPRVERVRPYAGDYQSKR